MFKKYRTKYLPYERCTKKTLNVSLVITFHSLSLPINGISYCFSKCNTAVNLMNGNK